MLQPALDHLARFNQDLGIGLPDHITVHLDAGYHSTKIRDLAELGCRAVISQKGFPLQAGKRWVIESTHSWHTRGFRKLAACTERPARVIEAPSPSPTPESPRRILATAWHTHR